MSSFSFLISVYHGDAAGEFSTALSSMLDQTRLPEQLVVVIDGEVRQEIWDVISKFEALAAKKNIQFEICPLKENQGLGAALQHGSEFCTGDFIVRMDADDISRSKRLAILAEHLKQNPHIDVLGAQTQEFSSDKNMWTGKRTVPIYHDEIVARSSLFNPMNHVTVAIRKSALDASGGYQDCSSFEDYYLWVCMMNHGFVFENLPDVTVDVRVSTMGERRRGMKYIKSEFNFAMRCYRKGFYSLAQTVKFISFRVPSRALPSAVISRVYRMLRSS